MSFRQQFQQPTNSLQALRAMARGNPQALFNSMVQTNPKFAQFVQQNQGKTAEQAFADYGLDYSQYKSII